MNLKDLFTVILVMLYSVQCSSQDTEKLYLIEEDSRYGYINEAGKTVIAPQFYTAGTFSEGLAPVRFHGTYGYINKHGNVTIAPKYDVAYPFQNGIAKVYIDGKPFFIDRKGEVIFQHDFEELGAFNSLLATAKTKTGKYGLIDKTGRIVVDTIFTDIGKFIDGLAVVKGLNHKPYKEDSTDEIVYEFGVIDTLGKWVVEYGIYENIGDYKNGFAIATLITEEGVRDNNAVIDQKGNLKFIIPTRKWRWGYSEDLFYNDVTVIDIYSVDPDTVTSWSSSNRYDYKGVINSSGEVLLSNPDWYDLTPFSHNRAFVKDKNEKWFMINKQGEKVSSQLFDEILFDPYFRHSELPFQSGIAFVKVNDKWGGIDTGGNYIVAPKNLEDIEYDRLTRYKNAIFFEQDISTESEKYSYRYGFWNTTNGTIIKPKYHYIGNLSFGEGLMYTMKDGRYYYINENGKVLWKQRKNKKDHRLNIDFMNRGYYYASSQKRLDLDGYGGWGSSDNKSKAISSDYNFIPGQLQVIINTDQKTKWSERYDAHKMYVANNSKDTIFFDAQDSRLYLKIQAKDKNGNWKDIEYLPSSWCGNSYHMLYLAPNEYWEFSTPIYYGEYKTTLRAELLYKKDKDQSKDDIIYSNEIEGYINPGQFWNKRVYFPRGLMDPYND